MDWVDLGSVLALGVASTLGFACAAGTEADAGGGRRFVRRFKAGLVIVPYVEREERRPSNAVRVWSSREESERIWRSYSAVSSSNSMREGQLALNVEGSML